MHFRDSPDSQNGLGIPGNIWFPRFAVIYTRINLFLNLIKCNNICIIITLFRLIVTAENILFGAKSLVNVYLHSKFGFI